MTYLDYAATSKVRSTALEAFRAASSTTGNPASIHSAGQAARIILDEARESIAELIGCEPIEILFTSGGTEAVNLGIRGLHATRQRENSALRKIISSAFEHQAGLESTDALREAGWAELVEVESANSVITAKQVSEVLARDSDTANLVSLMWVNNETGAISEIPEIAHLANDFGIPTHTDAVAALGKVDLNFSSSGVTAMSICGHKIGAPIGIGALVIRRDSKLQPLLRGGEQERGLRPGTTNYPLASAFAAALSETITEINAQWKQHREWTEWLLLQLKNHVPDLVPTLGLNERVASTLHLRLPSCDSETLVFALDLAGVSVSSGAACQAGVQGPSHVLKAMGLDDTQAARGLRISLGHGTRFTDLHRFVEVFPDAYSRATSATQLS